jgi:DNA-binding response OmpR family regulator
MNVKALTPATVICGPDAPVEPRLSDPSREWRILAVDDDQDTQFLQARVLARAGYNVTAAADGEEAWTALLAERFDLLLADHNMPRLCGLELVARMRAAGMTLPVIINSGCLDLGEAPAYPHLGLAAVLHKSFHFTELMDAVRHILPLPPGAADGTARNLPAAANNAQAARPTT